MEEGGGELFRVRKRHEQHEKKKVLENCVPTKTELTVDLVPSSYLLILCYTRFKTRGTPHVPAGSCKYNNNGTEKKKKKRRWRIYHTIISGICVLTSVWVCKMDKYYVLSVSSFYVYQYMRILNPKTTLVYFAVRGSAKVLSSFTCHISGSWKGIRALSLFFFKLFTCTNVWMGVFVRILEPTHKCRWRLFVQQKLVFRPPSFD